MKKRHFFVKLRDCREIQWSVIFENENFNLNVCDRREFQLIIQNLIIIV